MNAVRILLADDHTVMRAGLRLLLERQPDFAVVGEAEDGRRTVELADAEVPNVIVMDIAMPTLNGIEATRQIVSKHPQTSVVILSVHSDESYVMRALKAGARSFEIQPGSFSGAHLAGAFEVTDSVFVENDLANRRVGGQRGCHRQKGEQLFRHPNSFKGFDHILIRKCRDANVPFRACGLRLRRG